MLKELLNSITAPDMANIQVAVSDNASSDNTEDVVQAYKDRFPNFDYHRNEKNLGADANYLKAASMARGEYCIIMGSDDAFPPNSLSTILPLLESKPDILFFNRVECSYWLVPLRKTNYVPDCVAPTSFVFKNEDDIVKYLERTNNIGNTFAYLSGVVFNVRRWKEAKNPEKNIGTAFCYVGVHMQTLRNGATILYHPEALVLWRSNNNSFYTGDLAARVMLDLNGYSQIADDVFEEFPRARAALKGVVVRQWTEEIIHDVRHMVVFKLKIGETKWNVIRRKLREIGTPNRKFDFLDKVTPIWCSNTLLSALWFLHRNLHRSRAKSGNAEGVQLASKPRF